MTQTLDIFVANPNTVSNLKKGGERMDTQKQNQQLQIPDEIRSFLDGILNDAGMTNFDEQTHEEMIKELFARLDSFITATVVKNLPEEYAEEFIKLNEENKPRAEVEQFLRDKIPNVEQVMTDAFSEFRDLYLGNVLVARSKTDLDDTANDSDQQ